MDSTKKKYIKIIYKITIYRQAIRQDPRTKQHLFHVYQVKHRKLNFSMKWNLTIDDTKVYHVYFKV